MTFSTDGRAAPSGGAISLGEVFGGLNPSEHCFSCYLKQQGAAAQSFVGEPINTATGDFYESLNLFSLPGRGMPISFALTYDVEYAQSQVEAGATSPGPDGWGWTDNYDMSVAVDPMSDVVTVNQENGSQVSFTPSSSSVCASSYSPVVPRISASLSCSAGGGNDVYTLTRNGGLQTYALTYNSSSQLTEITESDANGNTTTVLFDQQGSNSSNPNYNVACPSSATTCTVVSDPAGRTFVLEYNASGQLTGAVDPDGNAAGHTWFFAYDGNGNLTSVTDRNADVTSFGYDTTDSNPVLVHDMTSLTPPNGQSGGPTAGDAWAVSYYPSGQVETQTDPQGLETQFAYSGNSLSPEGGTTTITDPHGNVEVDTYADGVLTAVTKGANSASPATWVYGRDPATLMPTTITDPNGNTTVSTVDSNGNPLTVTDPLGNETVYTYNTPFDEPLTITDPLGIETVNTYDSHGDLTETAVNGLSSTDISTSYAVCQTSCPSGYLPGDVESMTDPNGNTTTYTYDTDGDLTSSSLTVGSLTDVTRDSYNTLAERYCEVSPNANAASVSCPAFGASRVADTTTWAYDNDGNLMSTTDADGNTTSSTYDADGNQTQATDPHGNVTKTTYDADDRTSTVTDGYGTSSASTTTDIYDIVPASCPSAPTGTTYCTQVENGLSNTTTSYFDALNHMIEESPPNTSAQSPTTYTYDGDGNVLTSTDASGTTTSGYDADDHVTSVSYSVTGTHAVGYQYNADGNRTQMTDGTGTTTYGYDGLERLDSVQDGAGDVVTYKYDADGNPTCLSYPNSGSTTCLTATSGTGLVSYEYNSADQATQMTDWLGNTTSFTYDNDGNLTKTTYPSGTTTSSTGTYDNTDALTDTSYKIGSTTTDLASLTRNADELIGTTKPPGGLTVTYGYDPLNRVTTGTTATYSYDAASELTSTTPTGGSATDYAYNADGQLCWTAASTGSCSSAPSGATQFTYSGVGERLSSTIASSGHPTTYGWDQAGNLVCETASNGSSYSCSNQNSSVTSTYDYNGDGLQTSTTDPVTTWSSPSSIDSTRGLGSVSCPTTSFCAAVDAYGYAVLYSGSGWSTPSDIDGSSSIAAVSCTSSSFCMAVDGHGYYLKYNGSSWTKYSHYDTYQIPISLSCLTSSFCLAVDSGGRVYITSNGGTSWTHHSLGTAQLQAVTCLSASFCEVVDVAGDGFTYNGSTWSSATSTNVLWPLSLSCTSSTFCVDVGFHGYVSIFNGSTWSPETLVDPSSSLKSVACVSSSFCEEVDTVGNAFLYNGSSWAWSHVDGSNELTSVSCPTSTFCQAVDDAGNALKYQPTTVTSHLVWDVSGSVPQLLDDGGNFYLYGPNVGSAPLEQISTNFSTPSYLISDTTGVREQVNSIGSVVGSMSYDSYGNRCSTCAISTPFGFEGGYTEPTGLVYLIRRYYDPATEQFLSVDPQADVTGTPYAYTGGDPVNNADPGGECVNVFNIVCIGGGSVTSTLSLRFNPRAGLNSFNEHANPAYLALTGYYNEWEATENGCGLATELGYGGEGVLGAAGTLSAALGGAEAIDVLGDLGPFDETGAVGVGHSGDQRALVQLAKLAKQTGGVTQQDAQSLLDWADETGLPKSGPEIHTGRPGWGGQNLHIRIGPVNHIPVLP